MKKTKLGQELIEGLKEAISYERGEITLRSSELEIPGEPPAWSKEKIARLRVKKLKVSQPILAAYLGVSPGALKAWEQGLKKPTGSARRLLELLDKRPEDVMSMISEDETTERKKAS